jgi:hypothetical protein
VGPRAGVDVCENLAPTGIRSPDRPARSQSLYRLSYPAHLVIGYRNKCNFTHTQRKVSRSWSDFHATKSPLA